MKNFLSFEETKFFNLAILVRISSILISYVTLVVLSKLLNSNDFGVFAICLNLATLIALIAGLGQNVFILRFMSFYSSIGCYKSVSDTFLFSIKTISIGILIVTLFFILSLAYGSFDFKFSNETIIGIYIVSLSLMYADFIMYFLRANGLLQPALIPKEIFWRPIALAAIAMLLNYSNPDIGVLVAIYGIVLIGCVSVQNKLFLIPIAKRIKKKSSIKQQITNDVDFKDGALKFEPSVLNWIRCSKKLWFGELISKAMQYLVVVIVGAKLGPIIAGKFFILLRCASLVVVPLQSMNIVTAPRISEFIASNNVNKITRTLRLSSFVNIFFTVIIFVAYLIAGDFILKIFDDELANFLPEFLVLCVGYLVSSACGPVTYALNMAGYENIHNRVAILSGLICIFLITVLSEPFGLMGVCIGFVIGMSLMNIIEALIFNRKMGINVTFLSLFEKR